MRRIICIFSIVVVTASCSKRPDPVIAKPADTTSNHQNTPMVTVAFNNVVNGETLKLETKTYLNQNGDSFTITSYRYYISNIKLYTEEGKEYIQPESYYLVEADDDSSKRIIIKNLPAGNYTRVKFLLGIDSARNTTGAQTGVLDPMHGMIWDWNTGYIMTRLEGLSPQSPSGTISYHIGGFKGGNSTIRPFDIALPTAAVVAEGKSPVIHINSDIAEWFKTPTTIKFSIMSLVALEGFNSVTIANNYADMFSLKHVENK
jgi:hypothetical protein